MGSMSYCKFRNVYAELSDLWDRWEEPIEDDEEVIARDRLAKLCRRIAQDVFGE